jgi:type VI secretion system protein ImpG
MINPYYAEELEFLRELGREFAREYPTLAPALSEAGADPDVERVLEGVAFLTGLIRKRLEDDLPELTQTLLEMIWPHYLRPVPSMSIVEFTHPPKPKVSSTQRIPRETTELDSLPVDGTPCRFRTCYDVDFHPLKIGDARIDAAGRGSLRIKFEILGNAKLEDLHIDPLRLHLHGDLPAVTMVYLWLLRHTREVEIEVQAGGRRVRRHTLPQHPSPIRPVGFSGDEGLIPYPRHSFLGYRLLQEYFALPQKFLFFDVGGLSALGALEPEGSFELVFHFSERPPEGMRVAAEHIRLNSTPVVNLRPMNADPIIVTPERMSYLVRAADPDPGHFETHRVDRVVGLLHGRAERREYEPFYSFRHGLRENREPVFYKLTRRPAVGRPNSDCFLSFVSTDEKQALPEAETVSIDLTCTNRKLCESLRPGDIQLHTDTSPEYAEFRNITPLTRSVLPALEGDLHWRLISHLVLNYASLQSLEGLRGILRLYDFHALYDRQAARALDLRLEAIQAVAATSEERLFRGAPIRGTHTILTIDEDGFSSEGEMYLFTSVLEEFLTLYVSLNSFSHLTVRGMKHGETYAWKPRVGRQIIL